MSAYLSVGDRQIDQVLEDALRTLGTSSWVPACNVWEDEHGFSVQLALPGWERNQIQLEVNNQILTVKGDRPMPEEKGRYHVQEIPRGSFSRRFRLPSFVDHNQATAAFTQGMLTVNFPKKEEAKPRRIEIE